MLWAIASYQNQCGALAGQCPAALGGQKLCMRDSSAGLWAGAGTALGFLGGVSHWGSNITGYWQAFLYQSATVPTEAPQRHWEMPEHLLFKSLASGEGRLIPAQI